MQNSYSKNLNNYVIGIFKVCQKNFALCLIKKAGQDLFKVSTPKGFCRFARFRTFKREIFFQFIQYTCTYLILYKCIFSGYHTKMREFGRGFFLNIYIYIFLSCQFIKSYTKKISICRIIFRELLIHRFRIFLPGNNSTHSKLNNHNELEVVKK